MNQHSTPRERRQLGVKAQIFRLTYLYRRYRHHSSAVGMVRFYRKDKRPLAEQACRLLALEPLPHTPPGSQHAGHLYRSCRHER